jgi:hypothetical protein
MASKIGLALANLDSSFDIAFVADREHNQPPIASNSATSSANGIDTLG